MIYVWNDLYEVTFEIIKVAEIIKREKEKSEFHAWVTHLEGIGILSGIRKAERKEDRISTKFLWKWCLLLS